MRISFDCTRIDHWEREMDSQPGWSGSFDILGYQNLLEENDATDIARTIIPFLLGCQVKSPRL